MERTEKTYCVCPFGSITPLLSLISFRRSYLQEGVKTKNWEDRMAKTQKALAIKKLQAELKEEKEAEAKRFIIRSVEL